MHGYGFAMRMKVYTNNIILYIAKACMNSYTSVILYLTRKVFLNHVILNQEKFINRLG